jgi:putative ABC transport system permease protein
VTEALVSPRFFRVFSVAPELGRDFLPQEQRFGGPNVFIISHRLWMHRFNGDPQVVGKQLHIEGRSATIVGVMPAGFRFLDKDVDIWTPSPSDAPYAQDRNSTWYYKVVGRLKSGTTLAQAQANLSAVQARLANLYAATDSKIGVEIDPLKDIFVADSQKSLWLLYSSVTLLLLIACINIAALLLARSAEREREISVRYSLGASRAAIISQLLTECFLLALIGSGLGLFVATAGSSLFRTFAIGFPRRDEITLNWNIVVYTLVCAVVATLLCGLIPAIRGTRRNSSIASRSQVSLKTPIQWILVGTQVALAVILLLGAGLMLRSFQQLGRVSAGFETSHVLTFRISGNWGETTNYKALTQRMDNTLDAIRTTPGVVAAATTATLPGIPVESQTEIKLSDAPQVGKMAVQDRYVSNGYFATMRIPMLSGTPCPAAGFSAIVNRSFVNRYLPNLDPVGHHVQFLTAPPGTPSFEIEGVAADAREQGVNQSPAPTVYVCGSAPFPTPYFLIQTQSDPLSMAETLRRKIHILQPARSVYDISPLDAHLSDNFAPNRLRTFLLSAFALSAIALACTGLYGTLSYFVTVRRRESGLRLALGATRGHIIASFFAKGMRVAAIGCVIGACLSLSFTKALTSLLFGITATDWPTWLCVISAVLAIAACASLVPAIRAAAVEPMQVLRDE